MGRRLFGTDGVRGVVGEDLTEQLVERLGSAFARWSGGADVLVGRDTRASGPALQTGLTAGLTAAGSDVVHGGVLPTPAVALLARGRRGRRLGVPQSGRVQRGQVLPRWLEARR